MRSHPDSHPGFQWDASRTKVAKPSTTGNPQSLQECRHPWKSFFLVLGGLFTGFVPTSVRASPTLASLPNPGVSHLRKRRSKKKLEGNCKGKHQMQFQRIPWHRPDSLPFVCRWSGCGPIGASELNCFHSPHLRLDGEQHVCPQEIHDFNTGMTRLLPQFLERYGKSLSVKSRGPKAEELVWVCTDPCNF